MMDLRHAIFPAAVLMLLGLAVLVNRLIGEEQDMSRLTLQQFFRLRQMMMSLIVALFAGAVLWAQR